MLDPAWLLLGALTILILVGVPVVIFFLFSLAAGRFDNTAAELQPDGIRSSLAQRRDHRRNVRALKHQTGIPIERLGADLRRLRRMVRSSGHSSATQQEALRQAYDQVLTETCAMLQLPHELGRPTIGLERDIERLRVEAMLEGHGIVLGGPRRHDQNA